MQLALSPAFPLTPQRAPNRRFAGLLALSLVLHGLLFALAIRPPAAPLTLPPIMASIRMLAATDSGAPAPAEAAAPAARQALPKKARQLPAPTEHRSVPAATAAAGPANVPAPAPATSAAPPAVPASAPPAAPAVAQENVAPAVRPQSELLAAYRQRLSDLLARQQEYPRLAAMRGWEGEVRLRLKVARKGNLLGIQLDHSSGFDVLDQHAVAMLERLATLPPLPDALEASEIQVVVPINYKLRKTT